MEEIEVNGETLTPENLQMLTKGTREKRPITTVLHSGNYMITDIHFKDDAIFLDVADESGKQIKYVNIFKEMISEDDYQWFKDCTNRQKIKMRISATEKKGEIIAANLVSFEK